MAFRFLLLLIIAFPAFAAEIAGVKIEEKEKFGGSELTLNGAGLRKRAKVDCDIEYFTTLRTIQALNRAEVAVLMIEADANLTAQDLRLRDGSNELDDILELIEGEL